MEWVPLHFRLGFSLAPWQVGYAVAYPVLCIAGLCWAARALFGRYVVAKSGGF